MKKFFIGAGVSMIFMPILLLTLFATSMNPSAPSMGSGSGGEFIEPLEGSFIVPVKKGQYIFNERFGRYTELEGGHYGVDMAGDIGTIIFSATNGVVMDYHDGCDNTPAGQYYNWSLFCTTERGNHLIVKSTLNGKDIYIAYYHMNKGTVLPTVGSSVRQGEAIGQMGASGLVTGAHLHFELQSIYNSYPSTTSNRLDPEKYLPLTPFGERVEEDDDYHYIDPNKERGEEHVAYYH